MSQTLYQKYRPASFAEVVGQEHIKTTIQNQLKNDLVAHAYLFTGPRGVGKTTLARLLAKAVNCEQGKGGEACGACRSCQMVSDGRTMDIFEIDAASHTGVDNVRENIIEAVKFAPSTLKRKVFIIDEVHMLSQSAFNALLKTLEEPPAHALFILATTELYKVPSTIVSRCQRFDFRRLNAEQVIDRLSWMAKQEGVGVETEVLAAIARLSDGCLRDAESMFGQVLAIADGKKLTLSQASLVIPTSNIDMVLRYLEALQKKQPAEAVTVICSALEEGASVGAIEDEIIEALREMLLIALGGSQPATHFDEQSRKRLATLSDGWGVQQIQALLRTLLEYRVLYRSERIPQLPLELVASEFNGVAVATTRDEPPRAEVTAQTPPPQVTVPVVPAPTTIKSNLTDIQNKWGECCQKLAELSGTLPVLLQEVELLGLNGNILRLGTKISFIADKLNEGKNRQTIGEVLCAVCAEPIGVVAEVVNERQDELVSELLGEFGGQVIS